MIQQFHSSEYTPERIKSKDSEMCHVHSSSIHGSQKVEAPQLLLDDG